ncbi:hypothetical protein KR093_007898 [Drosophila rubida]|uniref:Iron-sulfur cluster assembly 1 homolog, mitochondrial n=1 Tax=Drosophila rubida TaxID=30044 RepID=A0AAD4PSA2_9MUSC|nr:hypothetical protein KR093_007898 [Drosophila rubida]
MATRVVATATVRAVKGRKLLPTRAALTLTPAAVQRIKSLLQDKPDVVSRLHALTLTAIRTLHVLLCPQIGLKVGVRQRGCNGLSYTLDYANTKADKMDEEVLQDGVKVFIDKKAQLSLLGKCTEMDFVESKLSSEFVFNNPNIKGTCGCGESFSM